MKIVKWKSEPQGSWDMAYQMYEKKAITSRPLGMKPLTGNAMPDKYLFIHLITVLLPSQK